MMNQDIPTEALLKYIVKERDKYKDKLEKLIVYTKGLEARIYEMSAEIDRLHQTQEKVSKKAVSDAMKQSKKNNKKIKKAIGRLRMDLHNLLMLEPLLNE